MRYAFAIALIGIISLTFLGFSGRVDVSASIAGIVSTFLLAVAGQNSVMAYSSAKDPNCNTLEALDKLDK